MKKASRENRPLLGVAIIGLSFALSIAAPSHAEDAREAVLDQAAAERLFTLRVLPLLKEKCFACHGGDAEKIKGEFDIRSRASILKGGESKKAAVVLGGPEQSPLYLAIQWKDLEMPPKENDRLNEEQIEWIRRWISAGASWPGEKTQNKIREALWRQPVNADGVLVKTSGGLTDEWTYRRYKPEDLWAFQPLERPKAPGLSGKNANPIDAFVDAKLSGAGFTAAAQAAPRTLIRRATYDLWGLPAKPEEIDSFLSAWKEDSRQAWLNLINRLLDSPHYGEQWGLHWLDVVRYADTGGFSNDFERSNAWRYRDYVIRSFNDDKPYDRFIIEQIAGDEWDPRDPEMLIATGFLRMGPWGTAMVEKHYARQAFLDDLVNSTGETFLSTSMRCLKCHDHKFDPFPTQDYYRMYSAFATTQPAEREAAFLESENRGRFEQDRQHVLALKEYASRDKDRIEAKKTAAARRWYEERGIPFATASERKDLPDDQKPPRHVGLDNTEEGTVKVRKQDEWIWDRRLERFQPLAQTVYNGPDYSYNAKKLRMPKKIDASWRPKSKILDGGSVDAPGKRVTPGVLSALGVPVAGATGDDPYALPTGLSGRRLALAKWIADSRNPLATRSIVNRIWQYHFGRGIAGNANNFGAKGAKPTHPELLDWLAGEFVDNGWSIKRMHRLIMSSRAYQQAGAHADMANLKQKDPDNRLMAYFQPRRLTAEELRDSVLAVSGELNPMMGGLPVMPEINMEVALQPRMIQFSISPAHQPSRTPRQRNRRTIYTYRVRGQADPFLELFNMPNPNESCEMRGSSSVSPQAFTLMNSDMITDRSIAFALRLRREESTLPKQIDRAFRLAFGRSPEKDERQRLALYVEEMIGHHQNHQPEETAYPTHITRSLVEELTGEPFEYVEWLRRFEDYVPDTKPSEVDAKTRAIADLCMLLFNSNEFMYIY